MPQRAEDEAQGPGTMLTERTLWRVAVALLHWASLCWPPAAPAKAQDSDALVIAIIDMQRILREAIAVQAMQQEIEQRRSRYQTELQKKEEEIRNTDQELLRQRSVLTADVYAKKRQDLERQVAGMQREIQAQRRGLDEIFGQGMNQVRRELVEVVKEIATERGADLVLAKANVVLVRPDLEITDEALERLNVRLERVPLAPAQN